MTLSFRHTFKFGGKIFCRSVYSITWAFLLAQLVDDFSTVRSVLTCHCHCREMRWLLKPVAGETLLIAVGGRLSPRPVYIPSCRAKIEERQCRRVHWALRPPISESTHEPFQLQSLVQKEVCSADGWASLREVERVRPGVVIPSSPQPIR